MSKTHHNVTKVLPRNHLALVARQRNGGPMKDRRAQRGGARNDQAELLALAQEDQYDDWDW